MIHLLARCLWRLPRSVTFRLMLPLCFDCHRWSGRHWLCDSCQEVSHASRS